MVKIFFITNAIFVLFSFDFSFSFFEYTFDMFFLVRIDDGFIFFFSNSSYDLRSLCWKSSVKSVNSFNLVFSFTFSFSFSFYFSFSFSFSFSFIFIFFFLFFFLLFFIFLLVIIFIYKLNLK